MAWSPQLYILLLTDICDANFAMQEYILKDKHIKSPWISKALKKSSKKKQKLYIKFLKTKTLQDQFKYKTYKNIFKQIKTDSKRTWQVM